jgi:hypothetical protein
MSWWGSQEVKYFFLNIAAPQHVEALPQRVAFEASEALGELWKGCA